ncbi:MAG: dephospho-CoA kinase [Candidatus Omnitrophica bacterium]|nr:dephospho-CoA kinase [Candidatus Omnitrophota bacterium]
MYVIGLTGGIGTGKTTVAKIFAELGAKVISADQLARQLIDKNGACFSAVVKGFGKNILADGAIDRQKLSQIVFNDSRKLKKLEKIIHPRVRKEISRFLAASARTKKYKVVVLEVPLLFEAGFDHFADLLVVVKARSAQQIQRAARSLGLSSKDVRQRIQAQMPMREKEILADVVIDNSGSSAATKKQVKQLWGEIKGI